MGTREVFDWFTEPSECELTLGIPVSNALSTDSLLRMADFSHKYIDKTPKKKLLKGHTILFLVRILTSTYLTED